MRTTQISVKYRSVETEGTLKGFWWFNYCKQFSDQETETGVSTSSQCRTHLCLSGQLLSLPAVYWKVTGTYNFLLSFSWLVQLSSCSFWLFPFRSSARTAVYWFINSHMCTAQLTNTHWTNICTAWFVPSLLSIWNKKLLSSCSDLSCSMWLLSPRTQSRRVTTFTTHL